MPSNERPLAFVTGGSSGIGYELAKQFALHDYDVAISGSSDRVHTSAERLRGLGVQAWCHQADAGTHDGVEAFWRFVEDLGRPVDTAVLNVGIAIGDAFADTDLEQHLKVVAINVTGTTHMAKRVVDHMVANRSGRILIVSSVSATTPTPTRASTVQPRRSGTRSPRRCARSSASTASPSPHCCPGPPTRTSTATPGWAQTRRSAA
jgi:short-subunit dehydrogenase